MENVCSLQDIPLILLHAMLFYYLSQLKYLSRHPLSCNSRFLHILCPFPFPIRFHAQQVETMRSYKGETAHEESAHRFGSSGSSHGLQLRFHRSVFESFIASLNKVMLPQGVQLKILVWGRSAVYWNMFQDGFQDTRGLIHPKGNVKSFQLLIYH